MKTKTALLLALALPFAPSCKHPEAQKTAEKTAPSAEEKYEGEDETALTSQLVVPTEAPKPGTLLRAFVLGDGGEPGPLRGEVDKAVHARMALSDAKSVVLMPGDLFYPRGLPDSCDAARTRVIDEYVSKYPGIEIYSVTGNHDHGDLRAEVRPRTSHRESFFDCRDHDAIAGELTWNAASCGCVKDWDFVTNGDLAGIADLGPVTLVGYDSQTGIADPKSTSEALAKALDAAPKDKPVWVMAHHPFATFGPHGGTPVHSPQDVKSAEYQAYLAAVKPVIEAHKSQVELLVFGHDHVMEWVPGAPPQLVSGAASKSSPIVAPLPEGAFAVGRGPGFTEIDVLPDRSLDVTLVTREAPRTFHVPAP